MMSSTAIWLCTACAASVSLISLTSSQIYRKEALVTSELMSFVSFLPGFIIGGIGASQVPLHFSSGTLVALFIKNILYSLSFYLRYESLRKYGLFVGTLMLGTQPIVIFLLGLIFLGENLSSTQLFGVLLTAAALLLLVSDTKRSIHGSQLNFFDFVKYYIFPTLASALAIVWDRYFLKGQISGDEFFILDRITLVPALLLAIAIIRRAQFLKGVWQKEYILIFSRNWKLFFLIGLLFTLSVYTYNLALSIEKAAVVGLFRNSAYPTAAFIGAFFFKPKINAKHWLSFCLIIVAIFLSAF